MDNANECVFRARLSVLNFSIEHNARPMVRTLLARIEFVISTRK